MTRRCYRSIEAYVEDLAWQLRVGRRAGRRIGRGVADHLAELVAEEEAAGQTPPAAVRRAATRFGEPAELAAEFNHDAAVHGVRRAAWALLVCAGAAFVAAGGALRGWGPAVPWPDERVYHAVPELLVQVVGVCVLNALLLAVVAPAIRGVPLGGRPLELAGRSLTVAALAMLPVAAVSAGNVAGADWGEGAMSAFVAVTVPVATVWAVSAAARVEALEPARWADAVGHNTENHPGARSTESALDVLADCLLTLAARRPWSTRLAREVTDRWSRAVDHAPTLMSWLELRRHPWRTALTVSVAAGVALKSTDLILKGDIDIPAAAIEAAAVFVAFSLLGGLLGLRASRGDRQALDVVWAEG